MKKESVPQDRFSSFIGSAVAIKAMPMSAAHAKHAGATNVPEKYFEVGNAAYGPGTDGYLVEYFSGYRSWIPKSEFEAIYKPSETKVDRMRIELADLNKRMLEVTDELYNPDRAFSPDGDRWLLSKQLAAMRSYADELFDRILYTINPPSVTTEESRKESCIQGVAVRSDEIRGGVNNGTVV